ncbi:MAG: MarR family transcriptional regulator [Streptosporangiales bacterium]|nr:MarR family transcriptional regulator [Streptosporangiales bacterium]MBO0890360.1 MarR family transcriptional regulator [Acidothermales bacterium]
MPGRRDETEVRQLVEHLAMLFNDLGMPRMPARVMFAVAAAETDGLTAPEIAEQLGVSPAAVSGAVRYLAPLGMLTRAPVPGSRRDVYRLTTNVWYEASMTRSEPLAKAAELAGQAARAVGGPRTVAGARLAEMGDFFAFLVEQTPELIERWRKRKAELGYSA